MPESSNQGCGLRVARPLPLLQQFMSASGPCVGPQALHQPPFSTSISQPCLFLTRQRRRHATDAPLDPVLNVEVVHTMENSSVATPPAIEEGFSRGSPSARTPLVEVTMPMTISPRTAKRTRDSTIGSSRFDRTKRARCMVGSPTLRIINQIQVSSTLRSPRSTAT